jgi:hypothetical protein
VLGRAVVVPARDRDRDLDREQLGSVRLGSALKLN